MAIRGRPQIALAEKFIEDPELEQLLEERETVNAAKKEAADEFKEIDEKTKAYIERIAPDIPVGERRRCGRFVISKTETEEAEVVFTRGGKVRVNIRLSGDSE
jgi:hypothetical protein